MCPYVCVCVCVCEFAYLSLSLSLTLQVKASVPQDPCTKPKPAPFNLSKKMESYSDESFSLSYWDYFTFLLFRPILAVVFTLSLLLFGWFLAWKLVLVHVPLVQEIFGLRKKPVKPKPAGRRRFTQFYNRINAQTPSLE
ncbi:hypothetical protein Pfo_017293, partial [Paulownia fortunei]